MSDRPAGADTWRAPASHFVLFATSAMFGLGACTRSCGGETADATAFVDAEAPPTPLSPSLVKDPEETQKDATDAKDAQAPSPKAKLDNLALRRGIRIDCVELRPARKEDDPKDPKFRVPSQASESLGVPALTFFHPAFAKAHPGFDLSRPRLLTPAELAVLSHELTELTMSVLAASDLETAKVRWGKASPLVGEMERDDEWAKTRPVLAETSRALAAKAKAHSEQKEGLWVLAY